MIAGCWNGLRAFYTTEVQMSSDYRLNALTNQALWYVQYFIGRESISEKEGQFFLVEQLSATEEKSWTPTALKTAAIFLCTLPLIIPGTLLRMLSLVDLKVRTAVFAQKIRAGRTSTEREGSTLSAMPASSSIASTVLLKQPESTQSSASSPRSAMKEVSKDPLPVSSPPTPASPRRASPEAIKQPESAESTAASIPQAQKKFDTSLSPNRIEVNDEIFKKIIVEIEPRFLPLLEKQENFLYWKNTLLDKTEVLWKGLLHVYAGLLKISEKSKIIDYLEAPKRQSYNCSPLSKDYCRLVEQLAPILGSDLVEAWKEQYGKCCALLKKHQLERYTEEKAPSLFAHNVLGLKSFEETLDKAIAYFKKLKKVENKKLDSWFKKEIDSLANRGLIWTAQNIDDLSVGFEIMLVEKIKALKKLFRQVKVKLSDAKLTKYLKEEPVLVKRSDMLAAMKKSGV